MTTDQKETYKKWLSLVNMSYSELKRFYDSEEGKKAGLKPTEAKAEGIDYGRESARWILKMKKTPVKDWTPAMWKWANKQISFISRMSGNKGGLYDENGNKTRKHLSLLIWGNNPEKYGMGGALPNRMFLGEEGGSNISGRSVFEKAVELERQGKSNEDIRQETGWFRNPHDKKWRFEISDKNAIFDDQEIDNIKEYIGKSKKVDRVALSKVLSHPTLFRAYPDIKELEIAFFYASDKPKAFVTYNKQGNTEIIYNFYHEEKTVLEGINARVDRSSVIRGRRSGIIHEIQHVIQVRSRLGKGSSTLWEFNQLLAEQQRIGGGVSDTEKDIILKKAQENYWKSSGEIESREVENRIDLTQEQLSIHIPFDKIDFIGSPIVRINRPDDKFGLGGEVESDDKCAFEEFMPWLVWWE